MSDIDYYELVRQKLMLGPLYAPKHKKVAELLKTLWNDEEIKLLSQFESCDKPTSLKHLANKTGISKEQIKEILAEPLNKRTIMNYPG